MELLKKLSVILIIMMVVGSYPVNNASAADESPAPFIVELSTEDATGAEIILNATVTALVDAPRLLLSWSFSSGLSVVSGATDQEDSMAQGETKKYQVALNKSGDKLEKVMFFAYLLNDRAKDGVGDVIYLENQINKSRMTALSEDELGSLPLRGAENGQLIEVLIDSKTKLPKYTPSLVSATIPEVTSKTTMPISGEVYFPDNVVMLGVGDVPKFNGVEWRVLPQAPVRLYGKTSSGKYYVAAKGFLNDNGAFSFSDVRVNEGENLWVEVCASGKNVRVYNTSGKTFCYRFNNPVPAINGISLGQFFIGDQVDVDKNLGWFNIYEAAERGIIAIRDAGLTTTNKIVSITWNGSATSTAWSNYANGNIYLRAGDQWNDAVILRLMGMWFLKNYAVLPPSLGGNSLTSNPDIGCNYGSTRPNLAYTQGFSIFFSNAVRSTMDGNDDYADVYLFYATQFGDQYRSYEKDIELIDGAADNDSATGKGNYCHWQIAGTLWDILDTSGMDDDPVITGFTIEPFLRSARSKYNKHYPYNINQWWYGWTNTTGGRNGSSFGDELDLIDNFTSDHNISIGIEIRVVSEASLNFYSNLWLPSRFRDRIYNGNPGDPGAYPFATYTLDGVDEVFKIYSPYNGTYLLGVETDDSAADAELVATITDASKTSTQTIRARTKGTGAWWNGFKLMGNTGVITRVNKIQKKSPATLY
jgi:hypothetical protein